MRCALLLVLALPALAEDPATVERELHKWLAGEHKKLAERCVEDGLTEEARREFEWAFQEDPADEVAARMANDPSPRWVLAWDDEKHARYVEYCELRRIVAYEAADRYFRLGDEKKKALDDGGAEAAYRRALQYDADFAEARSRLGEAHVAGVGWVSAEEAARRAEGLLPMGGKWLPEREVCAKRREWEHAWTAEGPHFRVRSNHSEVAARQALHWAEQMHAALMRETSTIWGSAPQDDKWSIYLFATQADYRDHNRAAHGGQIPDGVVGFYSNEDHASHFWYRESKDATPLSNVVRHECLHQVLDAMFAWEEPPTERPHFWVCEGFARYFENLQDRDGKIVTGSIDHPAYRAAAARPVPLAKLVAITQRDMADFYDVAGAAAHFFMHHGDGELRAAFLGYVGEVHLGNADEESFVRYFKKRPEEFEPAWRGHLKTMGSRK